MNPQFWRDAWKEGRTGFHQGKFNDKLMQYFPQFRASPGQKVLVPLCGKTKDMLWLHEQNLVVRGIELYEEAVKAFFPENGLGTPTLTTDNVFRTYTLGTIAINCGDFFQFNEPGAYDFVYDRAALVALPEEMRENYVNVVHRSLKTGGQCLLITYEYDPKELEGPPFSITEDEINRLYQKRFSIALRESKRPVVENNRFDAAPSLKQNVYMLVKL